MPSIQAYMLGFYIRYQNILNPPSKKLELEQERTGLDEFAKMFKPLAPLETTPIEVNCVPAEWITPPQVSSGRTILYLHGGYYLTGSIESHRTLAGNIANAAQARTLIIAYRLAPEHPYPAGLDDTLTAYSWLLEQNIQPKQIFLVGDSAGGGLVLSALLTIRERGMMLPAAAVCLSPATNLSHTRETWKEYAKHEFVLNPYIIEQIRPLYLGEVDPHNPIVSPVFADLHDLPPILIQVGSDEALLNDSISFAKCAKEAGVDVTLEIWPRMQHVWQFTASMLPEGRQAIERIGEFIKSK